LRSNAAIAAPLKSLASVILRSRIIASEGKTPETGRKYYRPFWSRSLAGAAFRAMTGRTVNPEVPGSSPGRGAKLHAARSDAGRFQLLYGITRGHEADAIAGSGRTLNRLCPPKSRRVSDACQRQLLTNFATCSQSAACYRPAHRIITSPSTCL